MQIKLIEPRNYNRDGKREIAIAIVKEKLKRIYLSCKERCRVEEKVTLDRCYKCQEFGHKLYSCKS